MRTSQAARYARWAAYVAFLLLAVVAAAYLHRSWQARQVRKSAPPVVPATVQQQSAKFSFSKVEENRTIFTVRASRATEFKQGSKNLLEDVWITIYGHTGARFDNIHTQSCDYLADTGRVICTGEVQIDLESAQEAARRPGERVFHIATRNLSFDRESGEARSDQPVIFRFPYGHGRAVGLRYSSRDAVVRLLRDVELTLAPASAAKRPGGEAAGPPKPAEPLTLTGGGMVYRHADHVLRLLAPVQARQGRRELVAGEIALELDDGLRAKQLVASGNAADGSQPELRLVEAGGQTILRANQFVSVFHGEGWAKQVFATGSVRGRRAGPAGEDELRAERIEVEMEGPGNQARLLTASGGVAAESNQRGAWRHLEASALQLSFAAGPRLGTMRIDRGETLGPAILEWTEPATEAEKTVIVITRLRGQKLAAEFGERNRLARLTGRDGVELERRWPGRPPQVSASQEMAAKFGPGGLWTEIEQRGEVRVRQADRSAQADQARLVRSTETVTLTGSVVLADPLTRTTAQSATFNQRTGEVQAQGQVRTSYLSTERKSAPNLAPEPAHVSSDRLVALTSGGHAVYSGRARLWQGQAVIEANSIELTREPQQLVARGRVFAVFPQAAEASPVFPGSTAGPAPGPHRPAHSAPDLWRVRAGSLTYWGAEARARLEENVSAQARQGQISAPLLELFFSAAGNGAQQLGRAAATGGVIVRQGERRGTAERAEYTASEAKFVLSGGNPTLYDASRGTTTGRQLTFFFANDTILVDSEEGTRTLTKHRVEK